MEISIKIFVRSVMKAILFLTGLLVVFSIAFFYATLSAYNALLVTVIVMVTLCITALVLMTAAIYSAIKRKQAKGIVLWFAKIGMRIMLPLIAGIAKPGSIAQKNLRYFFIELNNIVVESENKKYKRENTMLLLPHCLQNNQCGLKITSNPDLCRRCGKCKIGELVDYARKNKISIFIATGGTIARNIIKQNKPELILSVACERDLMSGISDVRSLPVIGIINKQPNGSCNNTDVDLEQIYKRVEQMTVR